MSLPVVTVSADFVPPANAAWMGGIARTPAGAIYATTDTPTPANSITVNGQLVTHNGVLFIEVTAS